LLYAFEAAEARWQVMVNDIHRIEIVKSGQVQLSSGIKLLEETANLSLALFY
jgi:hypothetical protein